MAALFLGFTLSGFGFLVHAIVWKFARPRSGRALIFLFIASVFAGAILLGAAQSLELAVANWCPKTVGEWAKGIILGLALSSAYVMTYPAVEVPSPTLVMVNVVAQAGSSGMPREDLYRLLDDTFLVLPRISDLVRTGLAREARGRIVLTRRGVHLAAVFRLWRNLLGSKKGG